MYNETIMKDVSVKDGRILRTWGRRYLEEQLEKENADCLLWRCLLRCWQDSLICLPVRKN